MYDTFIISKKDYDIYMIFDELYNDLISGRIYYPEKLPNYYLDFDLNAQEKDIDNQSDNKLIKKLNKEKS